MSLKRKRQRLKTGELVLIAGQKSAEGIVGAVAGVNYPDRRVKVIVANHWVRITAACFACELHHRRAAGVFIRITRRTKSAAICMRSAETHTFKSSSSRLLACTQILGSVTSRHSMLGILILNSAQKPVSWSP